jgi:hypothetical protein
MDIEVAARNTQGKFVEDLVLLLPFPPEVTAVSPTPTSGIAGFDPVRPLTPFVIQIMNCF